MATSGSFRRKALALVLFGCLARGEIIDRIAVTIEDQVITQSQTVEELRVTAFLNGDKPDLGPANRRRTADRLVEQALIRREMEFTHYPGPEESEIEATLKQVKSRFAGETEFERELKAGGLDADELKRALTHQAVVLHFIELRFRPEVQVQEPEVREYYDTVLLPEYQKKQLQAPAFEDARDRCEDALIERLVDKRVDAWLKEVKGRTRIRYVEEAFQ